MPQSDPAPSPAADEHPLTKEWNNLPQIVAPAVQFCGDRMAAALNEQQREIARLKAERWTPVGDNHHNAVLCDVGGSAGKVSALPFPPPLKQTACPCTDMTDKVSAAREPVRGNARSSGAVLHEGYGATQENVM